MLQQVPSVGLTSAWVKELWLVVFLLSCIPVIKMSSRMQRLVTALHGLALLSTGLPVITPHRVGIRNWKALATLVCQQRTEALEP